MTYARLNELRDEFFETEYDLIKFPELIYQCECELGKEFMVFVILQTLSTCMELNLMDKQVFCCCRLELFKMNYSRNANQIYSEWQRQLRHTN